MLTVIFVTNYGISIKLPSLDVGQEASVTDSSSPKDKFIVFRCNADNADIFTVTDPSDIVNIGSMRAFKGYVERLTVLKSYESYKMPLNYKGITGNLFLNFTK